MDHDEIVQRGKNDRAIKADIRRRHILNVSRQLFVDNGFHGTGVAQIAKASGVLVGQIYRDFSCKEDIIAEIVAGDLAIFLDEAGLEQAIAGNDMATIRQWILGFVKIDGELEGYRLIPEINAEAARNIRIAAVQQKMNDRVRDALMMALSAFAPAPEHKATCFDLADFILTLGSGLCQRAVVDAPRGHDPQTLCTKLTTIVEQELDVLCSLTSRSNLPPVDRVQA